MFIRPKAPHKPFIYAVSAPLLNALSTIFLQIAGAGGGHKKTAMDAERIDGGMLDGEYVGRVNYFPSPTTRAKMAAVSFLISSVSCV